MNKYGAYANRTFDPTQQVSEFFSGLDASREPVWHRTLASATLGSAGGTALNVSQACDADEDDDAVE